MENVEAFENNSSSKDISDSVKRKRNRVEGDEVFVESSQTYETPLKPQAVVESDFEAKLNTALQKLRTVLVKEAGEGVKAYHIFPNATMKQMCERIPRTLEELRDIHGIGAVKLNKYGTRVLETIEATIKENAEAYKNNISSNASSGSAQRRQDRAEDDVDFLESSHTSGSSSSKMETPSKPQVHVESEFSSKLYTALKKLRTVLVIEAGEGVMAYHIFQNTTMKQMCDRVPKTMMELRDIHGIGNMKVNKYGARVLETIEATITEHAEAFENHCSSNGRSDTMKRKIDQAEGDEVSLESSQTFRTPNSKMETPSKSQEFAAILYTELRKLRTVLVKEAGEGVMAYHIFPNATMKQMCERIPRTLEELRDIHGIGSVKLNKYGARVLETIEATIKENAEAYKNSISSNASSDSAQRRQDRAEGDVDFVESSHTSGRSSSKTETPSKPEILVESEFSSKLYSALKKLRTVLVKEAGEGVMAYHIFQNTTMKQMCGKVPRTMKELLDIHGIGNVKVNKYGARVLETIEATIMENAEAFENHSRSNGRSDTLKRKRDEAEGDEVFVESSQTSGMPNSKMETLSKSQVVIGSDFSSKLYIALRKLRTVLVKEAGEGVIAYHIFPNETLKQMCEKVPRTLEAFRDIRGIGNVKVNKYGARALETIEATIKENAKAYESNTSNNDRSDSAKQKKDEAEGDEVLVDSSHTSGRSSTKMETPTKPQVLESSFSAKLYTALRKLRSVLLAEAGKGVMAYHIFTNATLKQMCEKVPRTLEELLDIHGMGNVKVNMNGARVLETIEAVIKENVEAFENNTSSNDRSDSVKQKRDLAEGDEVYVESSHTSAGSYSKLEKSKAQVVESDFSAKLNTALRKLRTVLVQEAGEGVLAFHIFTNASLKQMCEKVPRTLEELLDIHGIGNRMVNKYGGRVLETIEATIKENAEADKNNSSSNANSHSAK